MRFRGMSPPVGSWRRRAAPAPGTLASQVIKPLPPGVETTLIQPQLLPSLPHAFLDPPGVSLAFAAYREERFVSRLCFILSCPQHRLYKDSDGLSREDLVFHNARIGKGIGQILIAREYHNGERGDRFATLWETTNVSAEDFYGNSVTIL